MALFGIGKKKEEGAKSEKPAVKSTQAVSVPKQAASGKTGASISVRSYTSITEAVIRPRITEKSGILSQGGVYTFEVPKSATKQSVAGAIRALYKVTPVKVAMVNLPPKNVFIRGRRGRVSGVRKAIVTVKKGEKIDFV